MSDELICMMCGKGARIVEDEPDVYREYGDNPEDNYVVWVYCEPCDVWTQHGVKAHA